MKPVAPVTKIRIVSSPCAGPFNSENRQPILTSRHESDKTEIVSALLDYRRLSPVASFFECLRNVHNLSAESRAPTRSVIANEFSRWRRRRSLGRAPIPAWTTSRNRQVLEQELCIATFLPATNF